MDDISITDNEAAAVAKAPRVSLFDLENAISERYDFNASNACNISPETELHPLDVLSICILVLKNGYTVVGKSAPAAPENYNHELGIKFAYEDALRQLWPLMGFALRERLAREGGSYG